MKPNELSISNQVLTEIIESIFSKNASIRFQVNGFSMSPFIQDADTITLSPLFNSPIALGRPVGFIHPQTKKLVIHRVVGKKNGCYIIKGDSLFQTDGLITKAGILGYVTRIERNGKDIRIGLDALSLVIAFLSRLRLLPLACHVLKFIPLSVRRFIKCRALL